MTEGHNLQLPLQTALVGIYVNLSEAPWVT